MGLAKALPAVLMLERAEPSEGYSEEKTEPFSQSEIEARFPGIGVEEPVIPTDPGAVSLDVLQVEDHHHKQGIRILVRPLTKLPGSRSVSPGSDNCQWLALRAEVAASDKPEHKVLAVTQTAKDIKFSVRIPGSAEEDLSRPPLWCELYYDPASDEVIFLNKSDVPILLGQISRSAAASTPPSERHVINPGLAKGLRPGTFRIKVRDVAVLDFRILEKRPVLVYEPPLSPVVPEDSPPSSPSFITTDHLNASLKRALTPDEDVKRAKRRISDASEGPDDGVIMFLGPAEPLVFPLPNAREGKEIAPVNGHALLDAEQGNMIAVPGVCELDQYQLTKRDPIASTALSAVFTASHSQVPNNIVTVKVLKTRVANPDNKPLVHERNVIRQADMWLRECQSQQDLQHESIVRYYGGDARYLSLYMEHIDAKDLTSSAHWRNKGNDEFMGTRNDSIRILRDISNALSYLHSRKLVHNDIKPANILYSPERGAVLCDFGLTTVASSNPSGGGTPYYIPPEFIARKTRGPESDVWALGVTMLYAMRFIKFPDSRARRQHPKPLYWQIAQIHGQPASSYAYKQYGNGQPAVNQMRDWLAEIYEARERLTPKDHLERLVKDMLAPNPAHRITMDKIVRELSIEQTVAA